jgi:hypothetical protein
MGLNTIQNRDGVGLKERNSISLFSFHVTSAFWENFISMYLVDTMMHNVKYGDCKSSHWISIVYLYLVEIHETFPWNIH